MSFRQHIANVVPNALVRDKRLCDLCIRIYLTLQVLKIKLRYPKMCTLSCTRFADFREIRS